MSDQPQREMTLPELVETLPHTHRAYQEYNMLVDELVQLRSAYENACLAKQHHFKALQAEQEKYREAMLKWSEESLRANELNKELESEREKLKDLEHISEERYNNYKYWLAECKKTQKELTSEREKLATVVARSEYVYQKAIDVQLSMPRQKLIKMEFSDLEDLRQLGAAIEDMGRTIAAIKGSK